MGTINVGKRLKGSLSSSPIDPGTTIASLPAVAMTNKISINPNKFHTKYIDQPVLPYAGVNKTSNKASAAIIMSPHPPGTAKSYGSLPSE